MTFAGLDGGARRWRAEAFAPAHGHEAFLSTRPLAPQEDCSP
jgi:hypothetical protein